MRNRPNLAVFPSFRLERLTLILGRNYTESAGFGSLSPVGLGTYRPLSGVRSSRGWGDVCRSLQSTADGSWNRKIFPRWSRRPYGKSRLGLALTARSLGRMNLVGKIFVVLILCMSVVFMAFSLAVYATH